MFLTIVESLWFYSFTSDADDVADLNGLLSWQYNFMTKDTYFAEYAYLSFIQIYVNKISPPLQKSDLRYQFVLKEKMSCLTLIFSLKSKTCPAGGDFLCIIVITNVS